MPYVVFMYLLYGVAIQKIPNPCREGPRMCWQDYRKMIKPHTSYMLRVEFYDKKTSGCFTPGHTDWSYTIPGHCRSRSTTSYHIYEGNPRHLSPEEEKKERIFYIMFMFINSSNACHYPEMFYVSLMLHSQWAAQLRTPPPPTHSVWKAVRRALITSSESCVSSSLSTPDPTS